MCPQETQTEPGYAYLLLFFLLLNVDSQQAAVCKREPKQATKKNQQVGEKTYRVHFWGEDGNGDAQKQQPVVNENDNLNDADQSMIPWSCFSSEMRSFSSYLIFFSPLLCCPCMVPLMRATNLSSTPLFPFERHLSTAWLPDLKHTKTPDVNNHCLLMSWLFKKKLHKVLRMEPLLRDGCNDKSNVHEYVIKYE